MPTRRSVLQSGIAIPSAVSIGAALGLSADSRAESAHLLLERFVFDVRFAEADSISKTIGEQGVPLSPIADDLMDLWYDELDPLWREAPYALAGVTLPEALFALETLALDRQMRVVYRGRHEPVEDGRMAHALSGPATVVGRFASLSPEADWQRELAFALTECPLGEPEAAEVNFSTAASGLSLRDVPLVSWIIAPRAEVALTIPS